jgi:hypothetical protein
MYPAAITVCYYAMRTPHAPLLSAEELAQTSVITLSHYNQHAGSFWEGTKDHDESESGFMG